MKNICFTMLNLLLAVMLVALPAQAQGIRLCREGQDVAMTGIKRLQNGDTVSLNYKAGQLVLISSDSGGTVLASSGILTLQALESGKSWNLGDESSTHSMDVTHLLVEGDNTVKLTAPDNANDYWLITYSACPPTEITSQQSQSDTNIASGVGSVSSSADGLQLPAFNSGQSITTQPDAAATAPALTRTADASQLTLDPAQPAALVVAVTALSMTYVLLRIMQISVMVLGSLLVLGCLLLGWNYRQTLLDLVHRVRESETVQKGTDTIRHLYGQLQAQISRS